MFGSNNGRNGSPGNSDAASSGTDFATLAREALAAGKLDEAAHLFVLAFDTLEKESSPVDQKAVDCLHDAWDAALQLKDRSLAEHVFEKLEPFCSSEEVAQHAEQLQQLALDRLEEFGISREDLQEMADMMSADFFDGSTMQISPNVFISQGRTRASEDEVDEDDAGTDEDTPAELLTKKPDVSAAFESGKPGGNGIAFSYRDLVGYTHAVEAMKEHGVGLAGDKRFEEFSAMLTRRHGLAGIPSHHTLLIRAHARDDANQFMAATVGEMGLPTVRMYLEDTPQGFPVLCVTASPDVKPKSHLNRGFDGPGVLVLEDIDTWGPPLSGPVDEFDPIALAQLSRGAREAFMLIRMAVENPQVTVMATCAVGAQLEQFFLDLLDPIMPFDIDVPDDEERAEVWKHIASMYPSLRFIDRSDLVRLSRNMSREDIYLAARESVEQAYQSSMKKRKYVPVTRDNLFDKIAAYQPLDSNEYHELEDAAVRSWRTTIDNLEQLLNKEEEK